VRACEGHRVLNGYASLYDDIYNRVDENDRDYSFLRLASRDSNDDSDIESETLDVSIGSNMNDDTIDVSCMDRLQHEHLIEPAALVAQVSYANGDGSTNWIIDSGSTYHMNGFANEFLNMKMKGYDNGLIVKGLVSGRKTFGIGFCIVVVKNSVGMLHQICLEDVLFVSNLLHHHPRIFSFMSACSHDECQCHFQLNSYALSIKSTKIDLHLSKGLLWIPVVDHSTMPHFVSVIFKIRDAFSRAMFLVHNGTYNTISIPG
jgi:hypothetical protein